MAKVRMFEWEENKVYPTIMCPGCGHSHIFDQRWSFNGDMNKPTFNPSMLVHWVDHPNPPEKDENGEYVLGPDGRLKGSKDMVCHSFVRDGMIQFLGDCTHELKGKTVELPEL